jgi:SNF2 family DNA or RNA helicase
MEIINNIALKFFTRRPEPVLHTIKQSVDLGDRGDGVHELLVKWSLPNTQKLAQLGYKKTPSPIVRDYDWPGVYTPMSHQKETASFITANKRSFVFSEAGTCKTACVVWALDYLIKKGIIKRALVICPLSIIQAAWAQEFFRLATHLKVGLAYGTADVRKKIVKGKDQIIIVNYDGVSIIKEEIAAGGFGAVIVDEATALKNSQTKRWKVINKLVGKDSYLWLLTGTPAAQSPVDAFGLGKLVCPSRCPAFFGTFRDQVMQKVSTFRWIPKPTAQAKVFTLLQPAIRFTKAECLDLPAVTYQTREVELTEEQLVYYTKLKREMTMLAEGGEPITAVNAAVLMNKLLQISAGTVYSDERETVTFDASNRLQVLEEVINETSHKVLIYAAFTHSVDQIYEFLRGKFSAEIIDGRVTGTKRNDIIQRFQRDENPRVLVLHPQAAAHGLTLTKADCITWFSPITSVEHYNQANDRIHRQGQTNKCTIVHLIGSPVERKVFSMLQKKQEIFQSTVDLFKSV